MRFTQLLNLCLFLASNSQFVRSQMIPTRDYDNRDYFTVELGDPQHLQDFSQKYPSFKFEHAFRGLDNHYVFSVDKQLNKDDNKLFGINDDEYWDRAAALSKRDVSSLHKRMVDEPIIKALHLLEPRQLQKRAPVRVREDGDNGSENDPKYKAVFAAKKKYSIPDPEFKNQWHIINAQYPGNDVNITGVWDLGVTGKNVTVAIIDDGVDYTSEDLKDAFNKEGSWDFNANQNLPMPTLVDDYHGTRCAGEIAARKNDFCGVGVATDAKVSGLRILSGKITSEDEAAAMMYRNNVNDIYSCSWGPTDDGKSMQAPALLVKKAVVKSVLDGRQGKGSLYVFASGNGGYHGDSCNFDGYTNSIYSITVGAVDWKGKHPPYAEACAAVLTVTYSSGSGEHIHTTDIKEQCSDHHGGTSAAAPLAAGMYALVLEANPELTWRDVQYVTIESSVQINKDDGEWQDTAVGKPYSHKYGFGKIDAFKMVTVAKSWKNVKPQAWWYSEVKEVNKQVTDQVKETLTVSKEQLEKKNFEKIEHVTVTVDIEAEFRGKVSADLYSPSGRKSRLAVARPHDQSSEGFPKWTFMSVAHWGEDGVGDWRIEVFNHDSETAVVFKNFQLKFFGTTIDASKAKRFPLPGDPEPKDEEEDTVKEPVKEPVDDPSASPEKTPENKEPENSDNDASNDDDKDEAGKFKHSTKKHYGEYFFLLIIVGFCICLFYLKAVSKRRPHRRRAEDYEFDIINPESDDESRIDGGSPRFDYDSDNASMNFDSTDASSHNVEDFEVDSDDDLLEEDNRETSPNGQK